MTPKEIAIAMIDRHSYIGAAFRVEAEKMMGVMFDEMTKEQRRLAATCISAFLPAVCEKYAIKV